jgi:MFS family permease
VNEVFRSLRIRNYRLFALGQLISLVGTWAQHVGQDWLVLELSGGDGLALGIAVALQFGPMLVLGLYGGLLADRYPKRMLLVRVQIFMGVLALALGVLTATGAVRLWMVYVLAGLLGVATVVDNPTRQAFVSELVEPEDVPNAVALNSATFNLARILGPAIAGLLISQIGVAPVFFVNAASYIAVVIGLRRIRESDLRIGARAARARGQLREGFRYVIGHRDLLAAMVLTLVVATFGLNFRVTLALMAKGPFDGGAGTYGLLSAVLAGGAVTGALVSARRRRPRQSVLVVAAVLFGACEALLALMPNQLVFLLLLAPTGALVITFSSTANATVQLGASDEMRGRVMALYALVFLGGTPLGGPMMGWIAETWTPRASLAVGGLLSASAGLAVGAVLLRTSTARPRLRRLRRAVPTSYDAAR